MTPKKYKKPLTVDQKISRRTFISFGAFTALSAGAFFSWRWLYNSPREAAGVTKGAHAPLRAVLNNNEQIFRKTFSHNCNGFWLGFNRVGYLQAGAVLLHYLVMRRISFCAHTAFCFNGGLRTVFYDTYSAGIFSGVE